MELNKITNQGLAREPASSDSGRLRSKPPAADQEQPSNGVSAESAPLDEEAVRKVAEELASRTGLKVEMSEEEESGVTVLRIMTPAGDRVLRQIPPEGVLKLAQQLRSPNSEGLLTSLVQ